MRLFSRGVGVGPLILQRRSRSGSYNNNINRSGTKCVRGWAALLTVTLYLFVFIYLEGENGSYESVVATNEKGQAILQVALQERNATRVQRERERQERRQEAAQQDESDGKSTGERNSDFTLWRFLLFYMLLRILLRSSQEPSWDDQRVAETHERTDRFNSWPSMLLEDVRPPHERSQQFHDELEHVHESSRYRAELTEADMERLPLRAVQLGDDLLRQHDNDRYFCSVCLEAFVAGDMVRTIPCFHTFHQHCIDDWLSRRTVCPICQLNVLS